MRRKSIQADFCVSILDLSNFLHFPFPTSLVLFSGKNVSCSTSEQWSHVSTVADITTQKKYSEIVKQLEKYTIYLTCNVCYSQQVHTESHCPLCCSRDCHNSFLVDYVGTKEKCFKEMFYSNFYGAHGIRVTLLST